MATDRPHAHRLHSAATSPQPDLERARLTRQIRHGLPRTVQLETGRRLEPSLFRPSVPHCLGRYLFNSRPESGVWIHQLGGSMPPHAQPCMVMGMDALSLSVCQAVPQCWAPRLDGWKVIPSQNVTLP